MKDCEPLPAKTKYSPKYDIYSNIATLKINNIRPTDAGIYKCVGKNVMGKAETSAEGFILKTPNIDESSYIDPERLISLNKKKPEKDLEYNQEENKSSQPPKVIIPLSNITFNEGENISLNCKIYGNPVPKVTPEIKKIYQRFKI